MRSAPLVISLSAIAVAIGGLLWMKQAGHATPIEALPQKQAKGHPREKRLDAIMSTCDVIATYPQTIRQIRIVLHDAGMEPCLACDGLGFTAFDSGRAAIRCSRCGGVGAEADGVAVPLHKDNAKDFLSRKFQRHVEARSEAQRNLSTEIRRAQAKVDERGTLPFAQRRPEHDAAPGQLEDAKAVALANESLLSCYKEALAR